MEELLSKNLYKLLETVILFLSFDTSFCPWTEGQGMIRELTINWLPKLVDHESMCLTFYAWLAPIGKKVLLNNEFYVVCFGCRFYQSQAVSEQLHFLTTVLQNSISSFQNFYLYQFCF